MNRMPAKAVAALILVGAVNLGGGIWSLAAHSPYFGWAMYRSSTRSVLKVVRLLPDHSSITVHPAAYDPLLEPIWHDAYRNPDELRPIVIAFVKFLKTREPGRYRARLTSSQNLSPAVIWTYEE